MHYHGIIALLWFRQRQTITAVSLPPIMHDFEGSLAFKQNVNKVNSNIKCKWKIWVTLLWEKALLHIHIYIELQEQTVEQWLIIKAYHRCHWYGFSSPHRCQFSYTPQQLDPGRSRPNPLFPFHKRQTYSSSTEYSGLASVCNPQTLWNTQHTTDTGQLLFTNTAILN